MAPSSKPAPQHAPPMVHSSVRRTTCNRDCPDACGILAEVENGVVTGLRGDPAHPYTRGFLCYRTNHFLTQQYSPTRLTAPLLRKDGELEEVSWEEALNFCAETLRRVEQQHGRAAVFHYRSGGSLGLLMGLTDYFWQEWGPVTSKSGDICGGAGTAAQELDFGMSDSNDPELLEQSRAIVLWGKNPITSGPHLVPILKRAREAGAEVILIDPVSQASAKLCDRVIQLRPGGDFALAMATARLLFERGLVPADIERYAAHLSGFRALCHEESVLSWCQAADTSTESAELLAEAYGVKRPCASLVGWGLGRRAGGGATVRALDALTTISGNLGVPGGGVSFYFKRRRAFDSSFAEQACPRTIPEPLFGPAILEAKDPPIRAVFVTAGNPVAMLPESETTVRALSGLDLLVVCDSILTDTASLAHVVLPTPTLLEADDLLGAYGHHYLSTSEPVVERPEGVRSDLEIVQGLAACFPERPELAERLRGTHQEWKERMLSDAAQHNGVTLDALSQRAVRNPLAPPVAFVDKRFATPSGKVELITTRPPEGPELSAEFPLRLTALSTPKSQSSQWVTPPPLPLELRVHPDAAGPLEDGSVARLVSAIGSMEVRVRLDRSQRSDIALLPKGGHRASGACSNGLLEARLTDLGEGGVLYDQPVRLEPLG